MTTAVLSPAARRDLLAAVRWIAAANPVAAHALGRGVAEAARRIGTHPHLGRPRPELAGEPYRFMVLAGFPYVIVYNADRRPPLIVRILHGARDLPEVLRDL
ncbi:type II toxin-antitoxin system RelE/ParE family toxin [Azospirillum sp. ST 5-10]|uniref:type II toxin-antitoxin system RelE/ParE family toxin n=1 Tax=unclassified Azospirillum TaxID=2630922 RepID=UPI003F4A1648